VVTHDTVTNTVYPVTRVSAPYAVLFALLLFIFTFTPRYVIKARHQSTSRHTPGSGTPQIGDWRARGYN
jgi:hypothetical protein